MGKSSQEGEKVRPRVDRNGRVRHYQRFGTLNELLDRPSPLEQAHGSFHGGDPKVYRGPETLKKPGPTSYVLITFLAVVGFFNDCVEMFYCYNTSMMQGIIGTVCVHQESDKLTFIS